MAKGEIRFELDRNAAKKLANDTAMKRAMESVASDITAEMERRAPDMVKRNGTFSTETKKGSDGWEGRAMVKSPFFHWAEWGTSGRHFRSPQPFIRPAGQAILSKFNGRWKAQ